MQHMDVCCVRGHMYSQSFRCRLRQQVLSDLNLPGNINLKCVRASAAPVYFHARSCSRMTPQEVAHILQDPHAVPDSDDEEDDRERSKVSFLFTMLVLVRTFQAWSLHFSAQISQQFELPLFSVSVSTTNLS